MGNKNVLPCSKSGEKETTHIINSYNITIIICHIIGMVLPKKDIEK